MKKKKKKKKLRTMYIAFAHQSPRLPSQTFIHQTMNDSRVTSSQEMVNASNDKILLVKVSVIMCGIIKAPSAVGFTCTSENCNRNRNNNDGENGENK